MKFCSIDRTALNEVGFNLFSTNPKGTGTLSTEQFQAPRLSQLQPTGTQTVNFADLLNLFVYRPDLNIGATIKALQERDVLQILGIKVRGRARRGIAPASDPRSSRASESQA